MTNADTCNGSGQREAARRFSAGEETARTNLRRGMEVKNLRAATVARDDADWRAGYLAEVGRLEGSDAYRAFVRGVITREHAQDVSPKSFA